MQNPEISAEDLERYARQIRLPEIGIEGQRALARSRVLVVGAGGLGSPVLLYLAAAGVGRLGIADGDRVESGNLHRQIVHNTSMIGKPKTESAGASLKALNPHVKLDLWPFRIDAGNATAIVERYDVVVDGSDNFATRYLLNDVCYLLRKPLVNAGVYRFEGRITVLRPPDSPCYRCLYPHIPEAKDSPTCADVGVLGVLPGILGSLQAGEALKLLLGIGTPLFGRMLLVDFLNMAFRELTFTANPECSLCGKYPTIREVRDPRAFCDVQADSGSRSEAVQPVKLREFMAQYSAVRLVDIREPHEFAAGCIPGAESLPMGRLNTALKSSARDVVFVLYCQHGVRSAQALQQIKDAGFRAVYHLAGGYVAWLDARTC